MPGARKKSDDSQTVVALGGRTLIAGSAHAACRLPQQGQHALWQLVGLRHHGRSCLLQNLRA